MKGYTLSLSAKTLTITKAFEDAVSKGEGEAYDLYTKFMREIPGLTVIRKTHATPSKYVSKSTGEKFNCNQFKNLTYDNMEGFINGLPNSEDYLKAYNFIKNCGSLPLTSRYTAVRKWFVAQFPNFKITEGKKAVSDAKIAKAKANAKIHLVKTSTDKKAC